MGNSNESFPLHSYLISGSIPRNHLKARLARMVLGNQAKSVTTVTQETGEGL